jgi:hypothetical protein
VDWGGGDPVGEVSRGSIPYLLASSTAGTTGLMRRTRMRRDGETMRRDGVTRTPPPTAIPEAQGQTNTTAPNTTTASKAARRVRVGEGVGKAAGGAKGRRRKEGEEEQEERRRQRQRQRRVRSVVVDLYLHLEPPQEIEKQAPPPPHPHAAAPEARAGPAAGRNVADEWWACGKSDMGEREDSGIVVESQQRSLPRPDHTSPSAPAHSVESQQRSLPRPHAIFYHNCSRCVRERRERYGQSRAGPGVGEEGHAAGWGCVRHMLMEEASRPEVMDRLRRNISVTVTLPYVEGGGAGGGAGGAAAAGRGAEGGAPYALSVVRREAGQVGAGQVGGGGGGGGGGGIVGKSVTYLWVRAWAVRGREIRLGGPSNDRSGSVAVVHPQRVSRKIDAAAERDPAGCSMQQHDMCIASSSSPDDAHSSPDDDDDDNEEEEEEPAGQDGGAQEAALRNLVGPQGALMGPGVPLKASQVWYFQEGRGTAAVDAENIRDNRYTVSPNTPVAQDMWAHVF